MPKTLQHRRGTTAELSSVTGAAGEIFYDTTKDTLVVMDGSTAGGFPLEKEGAGTGATGAAGSAGATGAAGSAGATGAAGSAGATGAAGSAGATGAAGSNGVDGATGAAGSNGVDGATGAQGETGATGSAGAAGATGAQGPQGNFGGATFDYTFDSSTTESDPGTGNIRFNSGTLSSATAMYIDAANDAATNISTFLSTIDDSTSTIKGHFRISKKTDESAFALYTITSLTDNTGWFTVNCSYVSGNSTFSNSDDIIVTFARAGDKGDTGLTGATGPAGSNGAAGATGATGPAGSNGAQGASGATGSNGAAGATGASGFTGWTTKATYAVTTDYTSALYDGVVLVITNPSANTLWNAANNGAYPAGHQVTVNDGSTSTAGTITNIFTSQNRGDYLVNVTVNFGGSVNAPTQIQFASPGIVGASGATGPAGSNGAAGATGPQGASGVGGGGTLDDLTDVSINYTTISHGQLLRYDATTLQWENATVAGGAGATGATGPAGSNGAAGATGPQGASGVGGGGTLDDLTDVYIGASGLANGQSLIYDSTILGWKNGNPSIQALNDVNLNYTTLSHGQLLRYDATTLQWENATVAGATGATGPAGSNGAAGATGATGPAGPINNLTDVTISSVANRQLLQYDSTLAQWKNVNLSSVLDSVNTDILPQSTDLQDLGSAAKKWYDGYFANSVNLGDFSLSNTTTGITITADVTVNSLLADELLISENTITADASSAIQYQGDKGVVEINNSNLDVSEGDWINLPVVQTVEGTFTYDTFSSVGSGEYVVYDTTGSQFYSFTFWSNDINRLTEIYNKLREGGTRVIVQAGGIYAGQTLDFTLNDIERAFLGTETLSIVATANGTWITENDTADFAKDGSTYTMPASLITIIAGSSSTVVAGGTEGQIRYNKDVGNLQFYDTEWKTVYKYDRVLSIKPVDYGINGVNLPSPVGQYGLLAFIKKDGANTDMNKLIYSDGTSWLYVHDNSPVTGS